MPRRNQKKIVINRSNTSFPQNGVIQYHCPMRQDQQHQKLTIRFSARSHSAVYRHHCWI